MNSWRTMIYVGLPFVAATAIYAIGWAVGGSPEMPTGRIISFLGAPAVFVVVGGLSFLAYSWAEIRGTPEFRRACYALPGVVVLSASLVPLKLGMNTAFLLLFIVVVPMLLFAGHIMAKRGNQRNATAVPKPLRQDAP